MIEQTNFKMAELLSNEWFWLFILVTLTLIAMYIADIIAKDRKALKSRLTIVEEEIKRMKAHFYDIWYKDENKF